MSALSALTLAKENKTKPTKETKMPETPQVMFESCDEVDEYFREGRPYFNEDFTAKLIQNSMYFNRVQTESWTLFHGTTRTGFRLNRSFYDPCGPFEQITSDRCEQNSCDTEPEVVMRAGSDSYTFELARKDFVTQWFCVTDLMYRLMPLEEMVQFEETLALISQNVHEEFVRSWYIGGSGHKWLGRVTETSNVVCGEIEEGSWYVEQNTGTEVGYNMCYVRVNVDPADLQNFNLISELTFDMLDEALISLQDEDDSYRLDLYEATGMPLLEIILPDSGLMRKLKNQAKEHFGYWLSNTDFDRTLSAQKLGVRHVIQNYAFGYDISAPRFNVDEAFNATLTYDSADPTTWPRLIRVPRYYRVAAGIGCKYIPNPEYKKADFGIATAWHPKMFRKWIQPTVGAISNAKIAEQNFQGQWEWRRPDWECNRNMDQGFFQTRFRMAGEIRDPELGHTFLIRLDNSKQLQASCCDVQSYVPVEPSDCYQCAGSGEL